MELYLQIFLFLVLMLSGKLVSQLSQNVTCGRWKPS